MIAASKELHRSRGQLALSPSQTHARTHAHKCKVLWQIPHFILHFTGTWVNSSLLSLPLSLRLFPDHGSSLRVWSMPFFFFLPALGCEFSHQCSIRLFVADKPRLTPEPPSSRHHSHLTPNLPSSSSEHLCPSGGTATASATPCSVTRFCEDFWKFCFYYYLFLETEPRRARKDEGSQWKACSLARMSVLSCRGFCCKCRR